MTAAGYVALVIVGFVSEWLYNWVRRNRLDREGKRPPKEERLPCNLVEIDVDSYEFIDKVGKDFDPDTAFQGKAPAWPARVEPSRFFFADGEAYRDVELVVEAPDDSGPASVFNVNVRQGGVPAGGVTIRITRQGG
jgi:hypothetical protein